MCFSCKDCEYPMKMEGRKMSNLGKYGQIDRNAYISVNVIGNPVDAGDIFLSTGFFDVHILVLN